MYVINEAERKEHKQFLLYKEGRGFNYSSLPVLDYIVSIEWVYTPGTFYIWNQLYKTRSLIFDFYNLSSNIGLILLHPEANDINSRINNYINAVVIQPARSSLWPEVNGIGGRLLLSEDVGGRGIKLACAQHLEFKENKSNINF